MTVAMIVPSPDLVHMDFAMSAWALLAYQRDTVMVLNPRTSLVQVSRYKAVNKALDQGADHIFFVDSDLSFPPDSLARLLAHDLPFVGATYMNRRTPEYVCGVPFEELTSEMIGLRPMKRMPVGFCLIKAEVFDAVEPPWFTVTWDARLAQHTSEDYNFCDLAREAGYELMVDLDLSHELGHVGTKTHRWNRPGEVTPPESGNHL